MSDVAQWDELTQGGLARERTVLAWNRSALAVVVCLAALLRHVWPLRGTAQVVALALILGAVLVWAISLRIFTSAGVGAEDVHLGPRVFGLMTAGTLILATAGFVEAFVGAQ